MHFEVRPQFFDSPVMNRTILDGYVSIPCFSRIIMKNSGSTHHFHFCKLVLEFLVHAPHKSDTRISLFLGVCFQSDVGLVGWVRVMNLYPRK